MLPFMATSRMLKSNTDSKSKALRLTCCFRHVGVDGPLHITETLVRDTVATVASVDRYHHKHIRRVNHHSSRHDYWSNTRVLATN